MTTTLVRAIGGCTLALAAALTSLSPAHAAGTLQDSTVTSSEVSAVLTADGLAAESAGVQAKGDPDSATVAVVAGTTTDIPKDPPRAST